MTVASGRRSVRYSGCLRPRAHRESETHPPLAVVGRKEGDNHRVPPSGREGPRVNRLKTIVGKIPVVVRAIILGFAIQIVGVVPFLLMSQLNLEHARSLPWAALIEVAILWALMQYLGGKGWPSTTSARSS